MYYWFINNSFKASGFEREKHNYLIIQFRKNMEK